MKQQYLQTGKIVAAHGLHGDVKILPWADAPEFLLQFQTFYIDTKPYVIENIRVQKTCVLAKLQGIDTVEAASLLRDQVVCIDRAEAKLEKGAMFVQDLIGLPVLVDGQTIGRLAEVISMPANDVYVVKGDREYLIPAVPAFILERNIEEGYIRAALIEGM